MVVAGNLGAVSETKPSKGLPPPLLGASAGEKRCTARIFFPPLQDAPRASCSAVTGLDAVAIRPVGILHP